MERLLVLFICVSGCVSQSIILAPQNHAAVVSSTVTLQCKIEQNDVLIEYISWEECITPGSGTCRRISNDGTIVYSALGGDATREKRYSVENPNTKQFNLKITGILTEDAGKYRCLARNDAAAMKDSEIVILTEEPSCTRNTSNEVVRGDSVMMTCSVTYTGRWSPMFSWKVDNQLYTGNIIDQSVGNNIQQSIVVEVQPENDADIFSMDTSFDAPTDTGDNEASNKPAYLHSYPFDQLTVYFAPYQITTSPDKGSYAPGETISCSAAAKPPASYQWINTNTSGIVSDSSTLTVTADMLGYQSLVCRAYNQYGNATKAVDFNVYTPGGSDDPGNDDDGPAISSAAIGGICAAAVIIIILIIILAICIPRRKKLLKEKQANETRPNPPPTGTDVIRTPQPMNNKAPFPDEKVGHDTSGYDPYHAGPYDLEVPPYSEYDDVDDRKDRNVENLTYADLALEDVPRSRKPIQIGVDMTDYAEIQRV